jgi:hypothetical protein
MVCLPCIVAPVFLWLWYNFLYPFFRPFMTKIWGGKPVEVAKASPAEGTETTTAPDLKAQPVVETPTCPFAAKKES